MINYSFVGTGVFHPGVKAALGAAFLFGAGTPLAKLLLSSVSPRMPAGLLYFGSGVGLALYRLVRRTPSGRLARGDVPWFAAAILICGCVSSPCPVNAGFDRNAAALSVFTITLPAEICFRFLSISHGPFIAVLVLSVLCRNAAVFDRNSTVGF